MLITLRCTLHRCSSPDQRTTFHRRTRQKKKEQGWRIERDPPQHHVVCVHSPSTAWCVLWLGPLHDNTMTMLTLKTRTRWTVDYSTVHGVLVLMRQQVHRVVVLRTTQHHRYSHGLYSWWKCESQASFSLLVYRRFCRSSFLINETSLANAFSQVHVSQIQEMHLSQSKTNDPNYPYESLPMAHKPK